MQPITVTIEGRQPHGTVTIEGHQPHRIRIVNSAAAAVPAAPAAEHPLPADDNDFAPSPLIRRPWYAGVWTKDDTPVAVNSPPSVAPHESQTTFGVSGFASAKSQLLRKMSANGHQSFIRYGLWRWLYSVGHGCTTAQVTYSQEFKKTGASQTAPLLFAGSMPTVPQNCQRQKREWNSLGDWCRPTLPTCSSTCSYASSTCSSTCSCDVRMFLLS